MCAEDSRIGKFLAGVTGYFATPTYSKGIPSYAASAAAAFSISLPDIVTTLTLVYTIVLLIGAIPGIWRTYDFLRDRYRRKKKEREDGEA